MLDFLMYNKQVIEKMAHHLASIQMQFSTAEVLIQRLREDCFLAINNFCFSSPESSVGR